MHIFNLLTNLLRKHYYIIYIIYKIIHQIIKKSEIRIYIIKIIKIIFFNDFN